MKSLSCVIASGPTYHSISFALMGGAKDPLILLFAHDETDAAHRVHELLAELVVDFSP